MSVTVYTHYTNTIYACSLLFNLTSIIVYAYTVHIISSFLLSNWKYFCYFLYRLLVKALFNGTAGAPYAQNFPILDQAHILSDKPFDRVRLRILSNHGHPEYTCLYRFRVHGVPLP